MRKRPRFNHLSRLWLSLLVIMSRLLAKNFEQTLSPGVGGASRESAQGIPARTNRARVISPAQSESIRQLLERRDRSPRSISCRVQRCRLDARRWISACRALLASGRLTSGLPLLDLGRIHIEARYDHRRSSGSGGGRRPVRSGSSHPRSIRRRASLRSQGSIERCGCRRQIHACKGGRFYEQWHCLDRSMWGAQCSPSDQGRARSRSVRAIGLHRSARLIRLVERSWLRGQVRMPDELRRCLWEKIPVTSGSPPESDGRIKLGVEHSLALPAEKGGKSFLKRLIDPMTVYDLRQLRL